MPLQLTLDAALQIVSEPGFFRRTSSEEWANVINPTTDAARRAFWTDQATHTLMLRPLQLLGGWLNSADQADSIIGLVDRGSGKLVVNATNTANFTVFEANLKQNPDNPWVFHSINAGGTLAELFAQLAIVALDQQSGFPINTTDSRVIAYTEEKISGNQAMYLRWFEPDAQAAVGYFQGFTLGQFVLLFAGDRLQVWEDISESKDRTAFRHLMYADLFGKTFTSQSNNGQVDKYVAEEDGPHERGLLWLPFHRNLIYIESNDKKWCVLDAREPPRLNGKTGDDEDWDIAEDRELLVWGYSPSVGRFQVQKVKWTEEGATRLPTFTLDYSPASPLTSANFFLDSDEYRDTDITISGVATPPGYDNIANRQDECPVVTTDSSAQTREYGATFTFTASADQRYTPFLYGLNVRVDAQVDTWAVSATQIGDTAATDARIKSARITSSLTPGDSRLEVQAVDESPFGLDDYYFRSAYPVLLEDTSGPTDLFLGISDPNEVTPLHFSNTRPREVSIKAMDLWRVLKDSLLRDQRDWTGYGHIDVVDFIARQAGIDTSGADYPTPLADWNTPLGGLTLPIPYAPLPEGPLRPHWQPKDSETAADFIIRIANEFSGFVVGFTPAGRFYYLPSDPWFYNSSELTFRKSRQANPNDPCYEDPVTFETEEPLANVVQVIGHGPAGGRMRSALWVDFASILNPLATNFLGRWRMFPHGLYFIDGVLPCTELNRIARTLFQRLRRRHLKVRFHADYVPAVFVGRVVTLEGQPGTWRILEYSADYVHEGVRKADYTAELVEAGYGL